MAPGFIIRGNARAIASHLGHSRVVKLLDETLDEEKTADDTLTDVCQSAIFPAADAAFEQDGDDEDEMAGATSGKSSRSNGAARKSNRKTTSKSKSRR